MKSSRTPNRPRRSRGFTLIEIVIVIALIGLILGVVVSRIMGNQKRAEYKLAESQMQTIAGKIDQFQSDTGRFPNALDELVNAPSDVTGWLGPYSKSQELSDPWRRPIEYRQPGDNGALYQITSLGADGKAGGEGVDKDIVVAP